MELPQIPEPLLVVLRDNSLMVSHLTNQKSRMDLTLTNPRSVAWVPYYPVDSDVSVKHYQFALRVFSDDGMTMIGGKVLKTSPYDVSDLKVLDTETVALQTVGQRYLKPKETYEVIGHVHLEYLNLAIFASQVTKTKPDGSTTYYASVYAAGAKKNFTSWDDYIKDMSDFGNLHYASWIWKGDEYSVKMVNPHFDVLVIQDQIFFAISNHEGKLSQNFITSFSTDIAVPGRRRFNRYVIN